MSGIFFVSIFHVDIVIWLSLNDLSLFFFVFFETFDTEYFDNARQLLHLIHLTRGRLMKISPSPAAKPEGKGIFSLIYGVWGGLGINVFFFLEDFSLGGSHKRNILAKGFAFNILMLCHIYSFFFQIFFGFLHSGTYLWAKTSDTQWIFWGVRFVFLFCNTQS